MPAQIRPTRLEVSDRFPMLGFSIRAEGPLQRAEVALGSDPALFGAEGKARRTPANFYSTRAGGSLSVARGEAVFIVPPEVLARFIGNEKLYFGLAVGGEGGASPYISLKGLTGRSMQRVRVLPSRQQRAAGYKGDGQAALEWAGDVATPGMEPARPNGAAAPSSPNVASPTKGAGPAAHEPVPYDDGFGPLPAKPAAAPAPAAAPPPAPPPTGAALPAVPAQALDVSPLTTTGQQRPVTPPPVRRLAAWQKALIIAGLGVISGPFAPLLLSGRSASDRRSEPGSAPAARSAAA